MTRADEIFNSGIELATRMDRTGIDGYWMGYVAGLMRSRFGAVAVDDRRHEAWSRVDAPGEQARGYRDGYSRLAVLARAGRAVII